jgi:hypothetical protein
MKIIEQFSEAKSTAAPSEDGVAVSRFYAAVIDGATAHDVKNDLTAETPGHRAMRCLCAAVLQLPPECTAFEAVRLLTEAMRSELPAIDVPTKQRPTASAVIYSDKRGEVWQVGDCPFCYDGREVRGTKEVDRLLSARRAEVTRKLLSAGVEVERLRAEDPGRQAILPYIRSQQRLQNADPKCRRAFGVFDGREIPEAFVHVYRLRDVTSTRGNGTTHSLILASDGYPQLLPTLQDTEERLQILLRRDPLCIAELQGTKGVQPGAHSYDDRSYLRLEID